mmetsp:Transcript_44237/g.96514  ORF Transcript_44237/g.96514 Transcript_44237/m.96514 type:complete len:336 (-) Transcript_44237:376-1383(-)
MRLQDPSLACTCSARPRPSVARRASRACACAWACARGFMGSWVRRFVPLWAPLSALDLHHPAVLVLSLSELDGLQLGPQLVEDLESAEIVLHISVRDGGDRRNDRGGAARANLAKRRDLVKRDVALLHCDAAVARERHQHLVGDGRQDRGGRGRHVCALGVDTNKVGHRKLLHVLLLDRVEIERRAEARRLCNLERQQVGGVVAARLDAAGAARRRAVKLLHHVGVDACDAPLSKVVADRDAGDHELEPGARLQTEDRSRADEKRPDVERAARAVWRHILCVRLHRPVHRLQKHGLRHGRHHQTRRAHIHAVTILWDVAHADHPIFCSERFAALK